MIFSCLQSTILKHTTPTRTINIEKLTNTFLTSDIKIDKLTFAKLCQVGCINYNNKYSCPPYSPTFEKISSGYNNEIGVICYRISLEQYSDTAHYNRIRAANSILKSIIDRELLKYKAHGYKVLGSGSCRACKPCGAKQNIGCKKPKKMIYSLESVGIDVSQLVQDCFGIQLEWYKKGTYQKYTTVVGCILESQS